MSRIDIEERLKNMMRSRYGQDGLDAILFCKPGESFAHAIKRLGEERDSLRAEVELLREVVDQAAREDCARKADAAYKYQWRDGEYIYGENVGAAIRASIKP